MKKFLSSSIRILLLTLFCFSSFSFAQTILYPVEQTIGPLTATQSATILATVPEGSFYNTHNLKWTISGTVVGTAQLQTCTTALTSSCSAMTGSSAISLAANGTYTLEGVTQAFGAVTITISTCTSCTVTVSYVASNPDYTVGTLQDGEYWVPLNDCSEAATSNAGSGDGTYALSGSMLALKGILSSSGAAGNLFTCTFSIPSDRTTTGKAITITDITWLVGTVTTQPTSITVVTLKTSQPPTAASSETLPSATLVDATGGGSTLLPTSTQFAGFTVGAAGQPWTIKQTFTTNPTAVPLQIFTATIQFNQSASVAQTVWLFHLLVHYSYLPL